MDGVTASIYVGGKQVARKGLAVRPRDVFIPDQPEGNFIACGRSKKEFFAGKMDHFRIYRKVHKDFNALGPAPSAITQMPEWSEEDQKRADAWNARRKAKEVEIKAGRYGEIQKEIRKLHQDRAALSRTKKLKEIEDAVRKAHHSRGTLDRKMHESFRKLPQTVKTGKEIKELRQKIEAVTRRMKKDGKRRKTHPQLTKLKELMSARQQVLNDRRMQFQKRFRAGGDYKKAEAAIAAARQAVEDEKKRIKKATSKDAERISAHIQKLHAEARAVWDNTLRSAGLFGRNPHPGKGAGDLKARLESLKYHTTADWENRIPPEVGGKVTPRIKEWLKRVRGY